MANMNLDEAKKVLDNQTFDAAYLGKVDYKSLFLKQLDEFSLEAHSAGTIGPETYDRYFECIDEYPAIVINSIYRVFGNNVEVYTTSNGDEFFIKKDDVIINKEGSEITTEEFAKKDVIQITENIKSILESTSKDSYYDITGNILASNIICKVSNMLDMEQDVPSTPGR